MLGKATCLWPGWKSISRTEKAIKLQEDADDTFSTFTVRKMYETGT